MASHQHPRPRHRTLILALLTSVATLLGLGGTAAGDSVPALESFTTGYPRAIEPGGHIYPVMADFRATVGWSFEATSTLLVTHLGFYDGGGAQGLSARKEVGLWNARGDLLTAAEIPAGTTALAQGSYHQMCNDSPFTPASPCTEAFGTYRYVPVEPLLLRAGERFVIGGLALQPPWITTMQEPPDPIRIDGYPYYSAQPDTIVVHPGVQLVSTGVIGWDPNIAGLDPGDTSGARLRFPTETYDDAYSFAPNLLLTPVPEPALLATAGCAVVILSSRHWRRTGIRNG